MKLEVLHVPDCPNLPPLLQRLRAVTDLPITTRVITSDEDAARFGMAGSPTLLINGADPFAESAGTGCGVSCRLYRDEQGRGVPAPSIEQLRDAVTNARQPAPAAPGQVLSAWRTRARPLDPTQKAVHRAILRTFATTGHPPTPGDLNSSVTGGTDDRSVDQVLAALHDADAIRLGPDGRIAVAYPFSAAPTRHRVRIDDGVTVSAMCAIDALGVAAMLGRDTQIESVDITGNHPVTVTTTGGRTSWDPAGAVVFIGADAGGGPSADCCCDYLNFFTDHDAATAWAAMHPQVPGQILTQREAEQLGADLFGPLLTA